MSGNRRWQQPDRGEAGAAVAGRPSSPLEPGMSAVGRRLRVAIVAGLVLLTVLLAGQRFVGPSDGTIVQLSNSPWQGERVVLSFVLDRDSELRAGDAVTAVNGVPLGEGGGELPRMGDRVTYSLLRDGTPAIITVQLGDFPVWSFITVAWPSLVLVVVLLVIAAFVFHRRPDDRAAGALLLLGGLVLCGTVGWQLGNQVFRLAARGPSWADVVEEVALALVWSALAHFALVAPGATIIATRRRLVVIYCVPLVLHAAYLAMSVPSVQSSFEMAGRAAQVSLIPSSVLPVPTAVLLVLVYRSAADPDARTRMRWVLITLLAGGLVFLLLWTVPNALRLSVPPENLLPLLFLAPTLALGAAILRYRLFDIEVILRRSLIYGALTATVLAVYLTGAWLLGRLPGVRPELVAVVASGTVALVAPPVRSWLHRLVGRLIFGHRDDPFEVISRLGRIDAAADPQQVLDDVVETLAHTLRLSFVALELRSTGRRVTVRASYGDHAGVPMSLPLGRSGELGELLLAVRPGREPFGPADRRLLDALIGQVGAAAATVLLTTALQQSRTQLVAAREDERRRLHHRLHDGLGPALAAGVMQLEVALALMRRDPGAAAEVLAAQIAVQRELVADVRLLVYGLRPPALDQLGLADALRSRATYLARPGLDGQAMLIEVEEHGSLDDLPAAVEVAAFWICVEALNNAVKHARARRCWVRLSRHVALEVEIRDDGRGLPVDVTPGGGLVSMRERAEELGGTFAVDTVRDGAVVRARLPIREQRAVQ